MLNKCFRDFVYKWYENQSNFDSKIDFLQKFNEVLMKTFLFFIKFAILQISFFTSSQTFVSNQIFNINKFTLFVMLFAISKKSISSKFSRLSKSISKFSISSFIFTSKKFYLIVNNLFALFNEKSKFSNLLNHQNNVLFSSIRRFINLVFFISQSRIISYFKLLYNNQKKHKIKVWKTKRDNYTNWTLICLYISKLFDRTKFVKFTQSKLQNFKRCENVKSFKNDYFQATYDDLTSTRLFIKFFNFCRHFSSSFYFLNCSRVCRICYKVFDFNNTLYKHLKNNYRSFSSRWFLKKSQKKKNI